MGLTSSIKKFCYKRPEVITGLSGLIALMILFLTVALVAPASAYGACPKGKVNCDKPCREYVDNNGNQVCDQSEGGSNSSGSNSTNSGQKPGTASSNNGNTGNSASDSSNSSKSSNSSSTGNIQARTPASDDAGGFQPGRIWPFALAALVAAVLLAVWAKGRK